MSAVGSRRERFWVLGFLSEILATSLALTLLLLFWLLRAVLRLIFPRRTRKCQKIEPRRSSASLRASADRRAPEAVSTAGRSSSSLRDDGSSGAIITIADLKKLVDGLEERDSSRSEWELVLKKNGPGVSYSAKCREPKNGGPTEYLSTTIFKDCSPELLRDFYMDNEFRLQWDKTVEKHDQLEVFRETGIEIGRTVKKFLWMTPREYVLAWRLWEGEAQTFYCVIKACEHKSAPRRSDFVRVEEYSSGWIIRRAPGSPDDCEVNMLHSENIGLRRDMAKVAFSRGVWSYVTKMESNLRRYRQRKPGAAVQDAVSLRHMVQIPALSDSSVPETETSSTRTRDVVVKQLSGQLSGRSYPAAEVESRVRRSSSRRSISLLSQSMFLLGWAVFLGHGSGSLGKIAAAVFLNKAIHKGRRRTDSSSSFSSSSSSSSSRLFRDRSTRQQWSLISRPPG